MSVATRKYRLFCHTFNGFPAVFAIFNRQFSSGGSGGDGNSSNPPFATQNLLESSGTNRKKLSDVTRPDLTGSGDHSILGPEVSAQQGKYSTSNPIIPDASFPLPGNIGLSEVFYRLLVDPSIPTRSHERIESKPKSEVLKEAVGYSSSDMKCDLLSVNDWSAPAEQARVTTLEKFIKVLKASNKEQTQGSVMLRDFDSLKKFIYDYQGPIEVCTFQCPDFVKRELLPLFPERADLKKRKLMLVNMSHATVNDMSAWNENVESERENLIEKFVHGAQLICEFLKVQNYFADFIDPVTGKPFYSAHTNSSLFETDEFYERFGFRIDDLGCCKVIHHATFGNHVFVGTILTDAPLSDSFLSKS